MRLLLRSCCWPRWSFVGLGFCASAQAEVSTTPLTGFTHSAWTAKQGAPGVVWSFAQTTDGTLWIASDSGLFRFDGVRFLRVDGRRGLEAVSGGFTSLYGARAWRTLDGPALRRRRLLSRKASSRITHRATAFRKARSTASAKTRKARCGSPLPLASPASSKATWHPIGADWGLPENSSAGLVFDRTGTLWIRRCERLFYLPTGTHRFVEIPEARAAETQTGGSAAFLALDRDGNTWVADDRNGVRPISGFRECAGRRRRAPFPTVPAAGRCSSIAKAASGIRRATASGG